MVYQFSDLDELSRFIKKESDVERYLDLWEKDKVRVKIDDDMFSMKDIRNMLKEGKL